MASQMEGKMGNEMETGKYSGYYELYMLKNPESSHEVLWNPASISGSLLFAQSTFRQGLCEVGLDLGLRVLGFRL